MTSQPRRRLSHREYPHRRRMNVTNDIKKQKNIEKYFFFLIFTNAIPFPFNVDENWIRGSLCKAWAPSQLRRPGPGNARFLNQRPPFCTRRPLFKGKNSGLKQDFCINFMIALAWQDFGSGLCHIVDKNQVRFAKIFASKEWPTGEYFLTYGKK